MEKNKQNSLEAVEDRAALSLPPAPEMDPADYLLDMADFDMTEAQKIELLETLWSIMGSFARMGFEVDVCGLIFEEFNDAATPETGNARLVPSTDMERPSDNEIGERA